MLARRGDTTGDKLSGACRRSRSPHEERPNHSARRDRSRNRTLAVAADKASSSRPLGAMSRIGWTRLVFQAPRASRGSCERCRARRLGWTPSARALPHHSDEPSGGCRASHRPRDSGRTPRGPSQRATRPVWLVSGSRARGSLRNGVDCVPSQLRPADRSIHSSPGEAGDRSAIRCRVGQGAAGRAADEAQIPFTSDTRVGTAALTRTEQSQHSETPERSANRGRLSAGAVSTGAAGRR